MKNVKINFCEDTYFVFYAMALDVPPVLAWRSWRFWGEGGI
jgi:hypothetical protein